MNDKSENILAKSAHQQRVEKFMQLAQQAVPNVVGIPALEVRILRAKLMLEEVLETVAALGVHVIVNGSAIDPATFHFEESGQVPNLVEIIDGCLDVHVVTTGTQVACGAPDELVQALVDINNLEKFGPGGFRRSDGKWVKPPNHQPPDIAGALEQIKAAQTNHTP